MNCTARDPGIGSCAPTAPTRHSTGLLPWRVILDFGVIWSCLEARPAVGSMSVHHIALDHPWKVIVAGLEGRLSGIT